MSNEPGAGRVAAATDADSAELQKCMWLVSEAKGLSTAGMSLDEKGSSAEAILQYRRSALKLTEAAALCPDGHPDKEEILGHSQDLQLRIIYLESLNGGPSTMPVEDHIAPLEVSMDLSSAAPPADQDVRQLVADSGASGTTAALDEVGYSLVAALRNDAEMKAYIYRLLDLERLGIKGDAGSALDAFVPDFSGTRNVQTLAKLREALRSVAWVAPKLDPTGKTGHADKMQAAVALHTQAKELEARGAKQDAVQKYRDAKQMYEFVLKYDDRMKMAMVKKTVEDRISDLEVTVARLMLEVS
eukprot:TRINITY_DN3093_c1_g1_i1.p1 TRINITY_DN3093_c1_g1~~TRINITY_DN3093_c1_g1_i1.p1  ORF type:complete len:320 (-),score=56.67 TRINITY_DN3093_c1_g1_i1:103-1005(-)